VNAVRKKAYAGQRVAEGRRCAFTEPRGDDEGRQVGILVAVREGLTGRNAHS
jgi:hypothetical protein